MNKYKIYAGLGGSFGGAKYIGTEEFESEGDAYDCAFNKAVEVYESHASRLTSYAKVKEEVLNTYPEANDDDIDEAYVQEMERWLSYKVELVD